MTSSERKSSPRGLPGTDLLRSFLIAAVAVAIFGVMKSSLDVHVKNYDFDVYYGTGKAYLAGVNPYPQANIKQFNPAAYMSFIYPPYMLPFFGLLARMPYETANTVLFVGEFLALWCMVFLWRRDFVGRTQDTLLSAMLLVGLALSGWITWVSGNISYLEQGLLWMAFASFVRGRYHLFAVLLLIGSLPKLVPLVFLSLLLTIRHEKKVLFFLGYSGVAVVWLGLCEVLSPSYVEQWLTNAFKANMEGGSANPTSLMMFSDTCRYLGKFLPLPDGLATIVHLLWSLAVIILTVKAINRKLARNPIPDRYVVLFAIVAFCLVAPRLKDYALIMAVPSILVFSLQPGALRLPVWVLALIPMGGAMKTQMPHVGPASEIISFYWPQVVFATVWYMGLRFFSAGAANEAVLEEEATA